MGREIINKANEAALLADKYRNQIFETLSKSEKKQFLEISKLGADPMGKALLFRILDQAFRSKNPRRVQALIANHLNSGKISSLTLFERGSIWVFRHFSHLFPAFFVWSVKKLVRVKAGRWVFDASGEELRAHIKRRKKEGISINVNYLGEAIVGEEEANARLLRYLEYVRDPSVEAISIKISSLYSQIHLVAFETVKAILIDRFSILLKEAKKGTVPTMIHFDMEEYRDLDLTLAVFKETLDQEEFLSITAGIAIQAYLPDSYAISEELALFAKRRVARGGAPIKVRLVKGANLPVERIESELHGWPVPCFETKVESDANFLRLAQLFLSEENRGAIQLGVGSHNLFDIAFVRLLDEKGGVTFEMLEGMIPALTKILAKEKVAQLLYCPVVEERDFESAMAYLFRRLDETSSPGNFLADFFDLSKADQKWEVQKRAFFDSFEAIESLSNSPRRGQERSHFLYQEKKEFSNDPETDLSLIQNRKWAVSLFSMSQEKWYGELLQGIDGRRISGEKGEPISFELLGKNRPLFFYTKASLAQVEAAILCAERRSHKKRTFFENQTLLANASRLFQERRGELICSMMVNTFKTFVEADGELSEAIDFVDFYRLQAQELRIEVGEISGVGPTLVASPWNFPLSISCGGIASSLAAQNPILFKPAQEAVLVGSLLAQVFWDAGFDREEFQLILADDEKEGSFLVSDPRIKRVILTGGTETAKKLSSLQGEKVKLMAETGGKNCFILSAFGDHDLAIRDLLHSAFSNAGQKCSAASLLLLDRELYEDPDFKKKLRDAAKSLIVGNSLQPATVVPPLIKPPAGALLKAISQLDPCESWLLEPHIDKKNPCSLSPGIKWGVNKDSFAATQELFGPLLCVIPYSTLEEAIEIANSRGYALTSGLYSLANHEIELWKKKIEAGNLYINRPMVGARVKRQPFGGLKESHYGFGYKAGGPNTLTALVNPTIKLEGDDYEEAFLIHFSGIKNTLSFRGQENTLWYILKSPLFFRVLNEDDPIQIERVKKAALITGASLNISLESEESESAFLSRLSIVPRPSVRILQETPTSLIAALNERGATLLLGPASSFGRFELPRYLEEVSLSHQIHRYGFV